MNSQQSNGLDARAVPVTITASATNAAISATMPAVPGWVNVITGFDVNGTGATTAAVAEANMAGLGVALKYRVGVPASPTASCDLSVRYPHGLYASQPNQAVAVNLQAFGVGNLGATVNVYGYRVRG